VHAERLEEVEPFTLSLRAHDGVDQRHEHVAMANAIGVAHESRVAREVRPARRFAELRVLRVVAHREDHVAVGAGERLVGHDVGVRVAEAAGCAAAHEIVEVHHRHHRHGAIHQRQVEMPAAAASLALGDGREDRGGAEQSGDEVDDRDAGLLRSAARKIVALAGDAHESAHALHDEVVAGAIGVRAVLSEAGDRGVDEARVQRRQRRAVEPVARKAAGLEVLDDDVGAARELPHDGLPFGMGDVHRDRLLAAVAAEVISRLAGAFAARVGEIGRPPAPRVVTLSRPLDLPDGRTEICEMLRAPGAGEHAGEVEDSDVR